MKHEIILKELKFNTNCTQVCRKFTIIIDGIEIKGRIHLLMKGYSYIFKWPKDLKVTKWEDYKNIRRHTLKLMIRQDPTMLSLNCIK